MDARIDTEPRARRLRLETPNGAGEMAFLDFGAPDRAVDVVFLHANGFNAGAYRTILAPLAAELRILAPDQRGHGATELPIDHPRTTWLDLGDDLVAFLDAMRIERVALAGHSMGGAAALLAAAKSPERATALALFDPVILPPEAALAPGSVGPAATSPMVQGTLRRRRDFPSREAAIAAYRGRGAFRTWSDAQLEDYVDAGFRDGIGGGVELICTPEWEVSNYVNQRHDAWAAFEASICPIRILRAEIGSAAWLDTRLGELVASGRIRVETVPGTTHFLPMERPDLVRQTLREAVDLR